MPGPRPSRGLKATMSAELLGISTQTLRYWREHLDPERHNGYFSVGRLLAYRVLTVLIRERNVSVEILQHCDRRELFEVCEHVALNVLAKSYLYLDRTQPLLFLHHSKPFVPDDVYDVDTLALDGIVRTHRAALESMGSDASQRRYQLEPSKPGTMRRRTIIRSNPLIDLSVLDDGL